MDNIFLRIGIKLKVIPYIFDSIEDVKLHFHSEKWEQADFQVGFLSIKDVRYRRVARTYDTVRLVSLYLMLITRLICYSLLLALIFNLFTTGIFSRFNLGFIFLGFIILGLDRYFWVLLTLIGLFAVYITIATIWIISNFNLIEPKLFFSAALMGILSYVSIFLAITIYRSRVVVCAVYIAGKHVLVKANKFDSPFSSSDYLRGNYE
jgi:hypothetical protein